MTCRLLLLALLLAWPAAAQDHVRVRTVKLHRVALKGQFVLDCTYPEVVGRPDLDAALRGLIPPTPGPGTIEKGLVHHVEVDFTVTYNAHGLLSVGGGGLQMQTRGAEYAEAHPTKLFDGMTLDLKTARAYSLRDMFGNDAYARLTKPVFGQAAREMGADELGTPPDGPQTFRCYLTSKGILFYQLFDNFAAGSVTATLPYSQALPLARPDGPLSRLKK